MWRLNQRTNVFNIITDQTVNMHRPTECHQTHKQKSQNSILSLIKVFPNKHVTYNERQLRTVSYMYRWKSQLVWALQLTNCNCVFFSCSFVWADIKCEDMEIRALCRDRKKMFLWISLCTMELYCWNKNICCHTAGSTSLSKLVRAVESKGTKQSQTKRRDINI